MNNGRILAAGIQWHITSNCINRCKHCYTYGVGSKEITKPDLSEQQLFQILNNIRKFEREHDVKFPVFTITGGDPLITSNGWKIIEELCSEGRQVGILGIPERVSEATIHKMKKLGVMFYQVSLDGLKNTHDAIRGVGSFERTIEAIKLLDKHDFEYRVMFTVHNLNQLELLPLIEYLESLNIVGYFAFDFMIGSISQEDESLPRMLSADEAKKVICQYYEKSKELMEKESRMLLLQKNSLNRVLVKKGQNRNVNMIWENGCSVGKSLSILADGTVYPCRRLPIEIGNLLVDSFEDIYLHNPLMKKFRRRESWEECSDCKYYDMCKGCPAVSYAFTEDPFRKVEYCFLKEIEEKNNNLNIREDIDELAVLLNHNCEVSPMCEKLSIMELWESLKAKPVLKKEILQYCIKK